MQKAKRQPKNFLRYLVDEYILFRRDFYFEVDIQPSKLVPKITELSYESPGWWRKRRITAQVNKVQKGWEFALFAEQPTRTASRGAVRGPDRYVTSAKATGSFHWEKPFTIVQGKITTSYVYLPILGFLLFFIVIFFAQPGFEKPLEWYLFPLTFIAVFIFIWLSAYRDRNHLDKLIQEAVESAEQETQAANINP